MMRRRLSTITLLTLIALSLLCGTALAGEGSGDVTFTVSLPEITVTVNDVAFGVVAPDSEQSVDSANLPGGYLARATGADLGSVTVRVTAPVADGTPWGYTLGDVANHVFLLWIISAPDPANPLWGYDEVFLNLATNSAPISLMQPGQGDFTGLLTLFVGPYDPGADSPPDLDVVNTIVLTWTVTAAD